MHLDDDTLRSIEETLISAAIRPEAWPEAVSRIVEATGSRGAGALPIRGRVPGVPTSDSLETLMAAYFSTGWFQHDYRGHGIPTLIRTGLLVDQDITTAEAMRTNPFYSEFLGSHGFQWVAGLLVTVGDDVWCLTLQRTIDQGPFTPDEQRALRRLIAPLGRAATLARDVGATRLDGIVDTIESLRVPALLLDRTGRVLRTGSAAERFLGGPLDVRRGALVVPGNLRASAALQAHVAAAIWSELQPGSPALAPVVVERPGRRPLLLRAQPLHKAGLQYFDGARAILRITDLEETRLPDEGILRQLYGLTPREIAFCEALLSGRGVAECAAALRISMPTARSHLKAIFAKTGTAGQGELLLLLGRHEPR
ncbi:helix-turn-helix transcriptional regulator [Methylobacterium segetis]|uniref:helix-turn-helix transcriptional regulator n=1 Tax=Methylobacterium segetis TaxID=2488750 RepID=UPI001052DE96|nr:helix-turn-helix transcriptional regulator [Methylobacterium segetis]